ncbi:MAG: heavy metal translocating P-type ATPase [Candidatus Hydrogenedentes bacterium]|nr:heavy metal translocating P-type ATPase [Candidatus Hydrogenedentota bacterium]
MDCAEEVATLKRVLAAMSIPEDQQSFDLLHGKLTVTADCPWERISAEIAKTGMRAVPWQEHLRREALAQGFWAKHIREVLCCVSGIAIVCAFVLHVLDAGLRSALTEGGIQGFLDAPLAAAFLLVAVVSGAAPVLPKAWYALRSLRADMNLLMIVAITGALVLGEWFEAALVSFLFSLALLLETWSVGRARKAISALMTLAPATARYRCGDCAGEDFREAPIAEVPLNAIVKVLPGERIPLDGELVHGETSVNQAPITGESLPVFKGPSDPVFAGTINNEGAFEFRVTRPAADSSLARIIRKVEEAQGSRAPAEQWVERFARYYTPVMMLLALLVAALPPLLAGTPATQSIYQALVLLVIACPCALVISTPVSIVAGLTTAARAGVLIKGGAYLEMPARLKVLAFDKTGTLTLGEPKVQRVVPSNNHTAEQLLSVAAAIESLSTHPLAQAIVRQARDTGVAFDPATRYTAIPGKGAEAVVDGRTYWIGSHRLFVERGHDCEETGCLAESIEDAGHTVVLVGTDSHVCGLISIADEVRPESREVIAALKRSGIRHIVMLTGDNERTARDLAALTGVDAYYAGQLPEDKAERMRELAAERGIAGMVGDGVNDAPAMATAQLAIAMGAAGSDAAIETADIALMADDLTRLPWLVRHSRRTLRTIHQNVAFALGLKALVLLLALAGWGTLWLAILADMGASLLVIFNGLRLLRQVTP